LRERILPENIPILMKKLTPLLFFIPLIAFAQSQTATITINVGDVIDEIDPRIYGVFMGRSASIARTSSSTPSTVHSTRRTLPMPTKTVGAPACSTPPVS
jgi:hypothetical protein